MKLIYFMLLYTVGLMFWTTGLVIGSDGFSWWRILGILFIGVGMYLFTNKVHSLILESRLK